MQKFRHKNDNFLSWYFAQKLTLFKMEISWAPLGVCVGDAHCTLNLSHHFGRAKNRLILSPAVD